MTVDELLARLGQGTTPQERGRRFEIVARHWLASEAGPPGLAFETVWLWSRWPGRWKATEAGIDAVGETPDGDLWAVQFKATTGTLKKSELDKFLSESAREEFVGRLLVSTSDALTASALDALEGQEKPAVRLMRHELLEIDWQPHLDGVHVIRQPLHPRPHQEPAVAGVLRGFGSHERGQLIMACGTGKTLTSLFIAQRMRARRVLVLLPSLDLVRQTAKEWDRAATRRPTFLAVCSDFTQPGIDGLEERVGDLPFPNVTSDPAVIADFLAGPGERFIYATYHSAPRIAEAYARTDAPPPFDLLVCDEAHRLVGFTEGQFGVALDDAALPARHRLFMTATPRIYAPALKGKVAEAGLEVASMDDEAIFGPEFHRLTFAEAIEGALLADYRVVVMVIDEPRLRGLVEEEAFVCPPGTPADATTTITARDVAARVGTLKAIADYELGRVISFHSRIKRAREFAAALPALVPLLSAAARPGSTPACHHISGAMGGDERSRLIDRLREGSPRSPELLANVRCLTEGVDVPGLDGVIFADPRRSRIDIVQAVGRAIRLAEGKTHGTIVIPVFLAPDEDPEEALGGGIFEPVWTVVTALRAHDERLGEELDALRRHDRRRVPKTPPKIVLDLPDGVLPATLPADFAERIATRLVEETTTSWAAGLSACRAFREREGHLRVPTDHREDSFKLGIWVSNRRAERKNGSLAPDRVAQLENLGLVWDPFAEVWNQGLAACRAFHEREGHIRVPLTHREGDLQLGAWINTRRRERKRGSLSPARVAQLDVLGMVWTPRAEDWDQGVAACQAFRDREGHLRVPPDHLEDGFRLGSWIKDRRSAKNEGSLAPTQMAQLDALGMIWDLREDNWDYGLAVCRLFRAREGHLKVPQKHSEGGFQLGAWISTRRNYRRRGVLHPSRIAQLDELGMVWDPYEDDWDRGVAACRTFHEREGHLRVPQRYQEDGFGLGVWINTRRRERKKGALAPEKIAQLDALGMVWDLRRESWNEGLAACRTFHAREGHLKVPQEHSEDGFRLGAWISNRRTDRKKGSLAPSKIAQLDDLGMVWETARGAWDQGLAACRVFREREGHLRVPLDHLEGSFRLGTWINSRRADKRKGSLAPPKIAQLDDLGMVWNPLEEDWNRGLSACRTFREREGHLRVPRHHVEGDFKLGQWVRKRRAVRAQGSLEPLRTAQLDELGMIWDPRTDAWEKALAACRAFREREGHLRVPPGHREDGFRLGTWISNRRTDQKNGALASPKIAELDDLGMVWRSPRGVAREA